MMLWMDCSGQKPGALRKQHETHHGESSEWMTSFETVSQEVVAEEVGEAREKKKRSCVCHCAAQRVSVCEARRDLFSQQLVYVLTDMCSVFLC
jgi:hypothetical protein